MKSTIASAVVFTLLVSVAIAASATKVTTPYGDVIGTVESAFPTITTFKGIPFAKPPIGKRRFMPPEEVDAWTTPINASKFAPGCMAVCANTSFPRPHLMCTPTISENCLYLNIYSPNVSSSANLPVIFFIHGGDYIGGSGGVPLYDGSDLAFHQNVVVVTINYRLGLFGALYTGTIRGNMQMKDQRMALKWVNKAISSFGGNPKSITISGQSAGAFSVATHLTMPKSWGLFQKAIIVSDPIALLAQTPELAMELSSIVLDKIGCPATGGQSEIDCLQSSNLSSEFLLNISAHTNFKPNFHNGLNLFMHWLPIVDGDELPQQPINALRNGDFDRSSPVMFGTVANESVEFMYDLSPKPLNELEYYFLLDFVFNATLAKAITKLYGPLPKKFSKDARDFLSIIATDYLFYCPSRAAGRGLTKYTPTFMYLFDYVASFYPWVETKTMAYCADEVCHADDLAFIFFPFRSAEASVPGLPKPWANETGLARTLQSAWGNFARTGDPNPLTNVGPGVAFPRFNATENLLVNYSIPTTMLKGYRDEYCDFWDHWGYIRR